MFTGHEVCHTYKILPSLNKLRTDCALPVNQPYTATERLIFLRSSGTIKKKRPPLHLTLNKVLLLFACVCLTTQRRSLTQWLYILNLCKPPPPKKKLPAHDVTSQEYKHVTISMSAMIFTKRSFLTNVLSLPGVKNAFYIEL